MDCRVALCQTHPRLGDLDANFEAHHAWLDRVGEEAPDSDLVLFPELSLTGYFLRDLTQEVALCLDDERVRELVRRSTDRSLLFGLVEETDDHRFHNTMVFAEGGEVLQAVRKVHLPTYGIFEERRYFAPGDRVELVRSRLGRFGVLICEDAWHPPLPWLHFLAGADAFLVPSASPARGFDAPPGEELSSQAAWRNLVTALGRFHQCWAVHLNRCGFEEGALFWGGSLVVSPFGHVVAEAPGVEEHLLLHHLTDDPLRRARVATPLRKDAQPDLVRREIARLLRDADLGGEA